MANYGKLWQTMANYANYGQLILHKKCEVISLVLTTLCVPVRSGAVYLIYICANYFCNISVIFLSYCEVVLIVQTKSVLIDPHKVDTSIYN